MIRSVLFVSLLASAAIPALAENSKPQPMPYAEHHPGRARHALSGHDDAR